MKLIVLYILTPTCIEPTMHGSYFGENDIPKKTYVYWINTAKKMSLIYPLLINKGEISVLFGTFLIYKHNKDLFWD